MQLIRADSSQGKALTIALTQTSTAIERLLQTGMSTSSEHTVAQFGESFSHISSLGVTRLGSNLRLLTQEIQRYVKQDDAFSARRLSFFLNRSWLMCQGLQEALQQQNETLWQSLNLTPSTETLNDLEVITLGVSKKLIANVFAAFEFRLRVLDQQHALAGKTLIFSLVFSLASKGKEATVHPEAFLDFSQPQNYYPRFLLSHAMRFSHAKISHETEQRARLTLTPDSTATALHPIAHQDGLSTLARENPETVREQLINYCPSPFDLEIDLQSEILLETWEMGDTRHDPAFEDRYVIDISAAGMDYIALVSSYTEGEALLLALNALKKSASRPPLFALMHYELGQRVLQPLSVLEENGPRHLMLGQDKTDYKKLLKKLR
jgi:hypothetical protein